MVKKGNKLPKETGASKAKGIREKKSPETLLNTELKRVKTYSSAKNLHNIEPKGLKKHKSP